MRFVQGHGRAGGGNVASLVQLEKILCDIDEKTGTKVTLAPQGGAETSFFIEYGGKKLTAYLAGEGEEAKARVKLVRYLLMNADLNQMLPEREDYIRNILLGEGGSLYAFRFMTKYNVKDGTCFAVDILPEKRVSEALSLIERCLSDSADMVVRMDDSRLAVVKFTEEGQSPYEFALFLGQSLYEELGIRASVGVGCEMKSFSEIFVSYGQAATAVRMSAILHAKGEVHSYREYLLVRMLEGVPESQIKDYLEQFRIGGGEEIFGDDEMMNTAEEFLENSLNISETSRNLFMHRNTLMYRLDKIEHATGLNIRKFSDAVTFRVVSILHKLLRP